MEKQIAALSQACRELKLDFSFIDIEKNVMRVAMPWGFEYFQIGRTPFNSEVIWGLLRDKKHSYDLFKHDVRMPETLAFLDPAVPEEYRKYNQHNSIQSMLDTIKDVFNFPVVVKPNAGALGAEVSLCENEAQATAALTRIFNHQSRNYDYVALVQECIPNQAEYRLICSFKTPVLLYQRGQQTGFNAQYWHQGEHAIHVQDPALIKRLFQFVKPVYQHLDIGFVGFDIVRSPDDSLCLIELNSSPKFNNFIKHNNSAPVVDVYKHALTQFSAQRKYF